jgi:hypothetical protein
MHRTETRNIERTVARYKAALIVLRIGIGNGFCHTVRDCGPRKYMACTKR